MERCTGCGAALSPGAAWCGQCFVAVPSGGQATTFGSTPGQPVTNRFSPGPAVAPAGSVTSAMTPGVMAPGWRPSQTLDSLNPDKPRTTRWRKTHTTFGPVGRLVSTFFLVGVFLFLIGCAVIGDIFALGAAGAWGVLIMPLGLRDVWKAGMVVERKIG